MVLRVIAVAILSIFLMGATTVGKYPACEKSPEQYASFLKAVMSDDEFVVGFYMQEGCGFMKPDMPATVIERGPYWIKIKTEPEGVDPVTLYTSPEGIKE
jgi:hypothetical protein